MKIRVLSSNDVRNAVSMRQAIEIVEEAFIQLSAGQAVVPVRTAIEVPNHGGITLYMPAYLTESEALGLKIVSIFPRNRDQGRATTNAIILLNDVMTGEPRAMLDGSFLTALRTGAVSGVATKLMARPDAEVVAVFGAGVQGRTQLEAVCEVRDISRVWVYDTTPDRAKQYVSEMQERGGRIPPDVRVAASPEDAVRQADIICTATTSRTAVVSDHALKAGVHINSVGSFTPQMQEIEPATVHRARVVVDSREAAWEEAGDLIIARELGLFSESEVYAELGEVAVGQKAGRESREEVTFFKAVGIAIQDVSVAQFVLGTAETVGLGTIIDL